METTRTRVIGYIRVSTEGQADAGVSLDAQREKLRAYAVCDGPRSGRDSRGRRSVGQDTAATGPSGSAAEARVRCSGRSAGHQAGSAHAQRSRPRGPR
ncbi:MAG: recombinase family protein [Pseudomonadota bacterium]